MHAERHTYEINVTKPTLTVKCKNKSNPGKIRGKNFQLFWEETLTSLKALEQPQRRLMAWSTEAFSGGRAGAPEPTTAVSQANSQRLLTQLFNAPEKKK